MLKDSIAIQTKKLQMCFVLPSDMHEIWRKFVCPSDPDASAVAYLTGWLYVALSLLVFCQTCDSS